MKHLKIVTLITVSVLLMGAGIPNFFSGLIGKNVHKYCEKPANEQVEMIDSVNLYTGNHKVVVVCGEIVADSNTQTHNTRKHRIAR